MANVKVSLVSGGVFEYDDKQDVLYRITLEDGTIKLKLRDCPEVHIKAEKPKKSNDTIIDSYVLITLDPDKLASGTNSILSGLRQDFPYLDAYLIPVSRQYTKTYFDQGLLYDSEYNSQGFILMLVGGNPRDRDIKYYRDNMVGGITAVKLNGYLGNKTCEDVFGRKYPLVYISANVECDDPIPNNTASAGFHKGIVAEMAKSLSLKYKK